MGEYAELALEEELGQIYAFVPDLLDFKEFRYHNRDRWMQLNGDIIDMKDMSDKHLRNSIAMLLRSDHNYANCPSLHGLIEEQERRTK
jgi:hypothetical protein